MRPISFRRLLCCVALLGPVSSSAQTPVASTGLRSASDFASISDSGERSRAIFSEAAKVLTHPRCMNCHPASDRPLQGSGEVTDGVDITPAMREETLRRLALALDDLEARRADGKPLNLERDLARLPVLELETRAGELKIVPEPAGTQGYDDLRRRAERPHLGQGLRPAVASVDDHARMLAALDREQDREPLIALQRLIELEQGLHRGLGLEL